MCSKSDLIQVSESSGKGRGVFSVKQIKESDQVISEAPSVIAPKQSSPFVCVDCFDYINEQTGTYLISDVFRDAQYA